MSLIPELMDAFRCLPGVGAKSAQRMAYHLLERNRDGGVRLSKAIAKAVDKVGRCKSCRTLTEQETCSLCQDARRDASLLCVVENPTDVWALEQSGAYRGFYFVLMGHLSPLEGVGPQDLGLDHLEQRLSEGEIQEVILATNPTVEGEATAHFIAEMARVREIQVTRIAHGVPLGGELEYVDSGTLGHALSGRQQY